MKEVIERVIADLKEKEAESKSKQEGCNLYERYQHMGREEAFHHAISRLKAVLANEQDITR